LNSELCVWVYAPNTSWEEIFRIIGGSVENAEEYISSGQLRIIPHTEWYLDRGAFNEARVSRLWNELVRNALDCGYHGLRAVGDICWLEKSFQRSFLRYERNINKVIPNMPFIAACLYDINKIGRAEMEGIVSSHGYVMIKHSGRLVLQKNVELLIKEKQLEESRERYRNLIGLLPDSIFIHDKERIFFCNESATRIAGTGMLSGKPKISITDLVPPEMKKDFKKFINDALYNGKDRNYHKCKFICSDGLARDVEIISTRYNYRGKQAILSVVRDITPFRRIQELDENTKGSREMNNALEYDKIKMEFFSNISHEFRTPLNVILCAVQLLKNQKRQSGEGLKECKHLSVIQQNCYRLLRLVNNLIDLTRIDSDCFEIKPQNHDIISLIKNITMSVVEYARNKNITLTFEANMEKKITACDPYQIERIMLNLLSNAIKFTPAGGNIWVRVKASADKTLISVKDTGIGIPVSKQRLVFDRFQQADASLRKQYEGSGIGLSIVKALVEKHNGKIKLYSKPGKGSEFVLEIPHRILDTEEKLSFFLDDDKYSYAEKASIELSDITV
jgi:PAS domain S-box-containing protein